MAKNLQEQATFITLELTKLFKLIKWHARSINLLFVEIQNVYIFLVVEMKKERSLVNVRNILLKKKSGFLCQIYPINELMEEQ